MNRSPPRSSGRHLATALLACALTVAAALVTGIGPAAAQSSGGSSWAQGFGPSSTGGASRRGSQGGSRGGYRLSADDAAAIVRRSGAKVLDVRRSKGRYSVKLLTPQGRVRKVWVDGQTGQVSR